MSRAAAVLLFCLLAVSTALGAPLDRFEAEVQALEARPLPGPGATVFIGSSTFTRWTSLEREFARWHAVNRGFGGATIPEIIHYAPRLIFPVRPSTIVFYAGTNDVADGHSARQVCDDFKTFVRTVRARLPEVRIIFISMNMPPSRVRFASVYEDGNACIRAWIEGQRGVEYLDIASIMLDASGRPQSSLYTNDMLHMNEQGYARWMLPIKRALDAGGR